MGDGVSEDAKNLFSDAVARIDYLAESSLGKFRDKQDMNSWDETELTDVLFNLKSSYAQVYPNMKMDWDLQAGRVSMPFYSLQRSFSNLIQNSIEACESANIHSHIVVTSVQNDDHVIVKFEDNGPGVPVEILSKIFTPRASFGKTTGTGLGLSQVREEFLNYGAIISHEKSNVGACFKIKFPKNMMGLKIPLTKRCLLIGSKEFVETVGARLDLAGITAVSFTSFKQVRESFNMNSSTSLISELILEAGVETAFDLLDSVPQGVFLRPIISTSLLSNEEIYSLALKRGALLMSREQMTSATFEAR